MEGGAANQAADRGPGARHHRERRDFVRADGLSPAVRTPFSESTTTSGMSCGSGFSTRRFRPPRQRAPAASRRRPPASSSSTHRQLQRVRLWRRERAGSSATAVSSASPARASGGRPGGRPAAGRGATGESNREPLAARHQAPGVRRRRRRLCRCRSISWFSARGRERQSICVSLPAVRVGYVVSSDGVLLCSASQARTFSVPPRSCPKLEVVRACRSGHDVVRGDVGKSSGHPAGVWAIDLDSDRKPVCRGRRTVGKSWAPSRSRRTGRSWSDRSG